MEHVASVWNRVSARYRRLDVSRVIADFQDSCACMFAVPLKHRPGFQVPAQYRSTRQAGHHPLVAVILAILPSESMRDESFD